MFDAYKRELDINYNINSRPTLDLLVNLTNQQTIEESFLQLKIVFNDYTFNEITDVAAYSVDTLGSNIGGTLSLWLGVTVMLVVELLEFIYKFAAARLQRTKRNQGANDSTT